MNLKIVIIFFYFIINLSFVYSFSMDTDLSISNASFIGEDGSDISGYSVSDIGDVNGDGVDDFAIGAYGDEDGGSSAGQTYVIFGSDSPNRWSMDIDLSTSNASFWGEDANDNSGYSISEIGDVNGDGIDDFVIGAYGDDDGGSSAGQTYVIFGSSAPSRFSMDIDLSASNASFWGEDADDDSGFSVSGIGDVNNDGINDFAIGAPDDEDGGSAAGQTYVIFGSDSSNRWTMDIDLSTSNASFWGEDADDNSGHSISGIGDVNGDGIDDFAIGAPGDEDGGSDAGQTYVIFGSDSPNRWSMDIDLSTSNASFWGEDADDNSGHSISGIGDVNSDGIDDFAIGATDDEEGGSGAGQTYVIFGSSSPNRWSMDSDLSNANASFIGENASDNAGFSISDVGDVNDDSISDFIVAAPGSEVGGGVNSGQTYLIFGSSSPNRWTMDINLSESNGSFIGEDAGDLSGWSVSRVGDVNNDGAQDFIIGAWGDDDGGSLAGQSYVIFGESSISLSSTQSTSGGVFPFTNLFSIVLFLLLLIIMH